MQNPFFKNNGPFKVANILNILNLNNVNIDMEQNITDIKDLFTSNTNDITFFHSKKYNEIAKNTKASTIKTPGITGWPGKCPSTKKLSFLTFTTPIADLSLFICKSSSISNMGLRCGSKFSISVLFNFIINYFKLLLIKFNNSLVIFLSDFAIKISFLFNRKSIEFSFIYISMIGLISLMS